MANDGEDRLSVLPDAIIHHILSFMSTDCAVRTGTLSSRWLHHWKFVSVIRFPSLPFSETEPVDFGFVNHLLSQVKSAKIDRFVVVATIGPFSHPKLESWIEFAVARRVESLKLYLHVDTIWAFTFLVLPGSFFTQSTEYLRHLMLTYVDFNPPPRGLGFKGFASLKKLFLYESKLSDEALQSIMSTCLVLESLTLLWCCGLVNVKVSGVALKEFVFYQSIAGQERNVEVSAPNLVILKTYRQFLDNRLKISSSHIVEARIYNPDHFRTEISHVKSFISQFAHVELLGIDNWLIRFIDQEYYTYGERRIVFRNLKEFYFCGDLWKEHYMIDFLAFLGECPLLEKLQIHFGFITSVCIPKKYPLERVVRSSLNDIVHPIIVEVVDGAEELSVGHFHQLKTIELFCFFGHKNQIELVKHLLEKAVNLDRLLLFYDDPPDHQIMRMRPSFVVSLHEKELFRDQVLLLPRASAHAEIFFG